MLTAYCRLICTLSTSGCEITASAQQSGQTIAASDELIAATARQHGLHIMTRSVNDFKPNGGLLINPWA